MSSGSESREMAALRVDGARVDGNPEQSGELTTLCEPLPGNVAATGLLVLVCLSFALLWWNRFLAVTNEGWHFFFAHQIVQGKVPYRDFYLFVPPLLQLEMAGMIKVFGDHLIVSQIVGLLELCVLAIALYSWMARVFPSPDAFLAAVVGIVLATANRSEELNALHMSAIFHTTLAGWVATLAVGGRTVRAKSAFWGGILAGLAFLVKQTSGIATVLSLTFLLWVAAWHWHGWRRAGQIVLLFLAGCAIPLLLVGAWLASNGALRDALADVFLRGTSSKGSPAQMISRLASFLAESAYLRRHALFALVSVVGFVAICRKSIAALGKSDAARPARPWMAAGWSALAIFAGWGLSFWPSFHIPGTLINLPANSGAFLAESGSAVLFVICFWRLLSDQLERSQIQFFLLAGFSCGVAFLSSLSWPTSVGMIVPALSFVLASILSGLRGAPRGRIFRPIAVFLCLLWVAQSSWQKCSSPFDWAGWREPDIHRATVALKYPELKGYRVSPETAAFVTRVTDEISAHSSADQSLFVYPNLPIFYLLSHRQPETMGYVHFVDVAPDYVDLADAATLRRHPPAVIVVLKPTEDELRMGEKYFRSGRRSAQRDLLDAIAEIRPQYELVDSITTPVTAKTVEVLARK